jgi:signal transduction histidine kinase
MTVGGNLSFRIATILLGGFVLLQALVWAATTLPGRGSERRPYNLPQPAQLAAMVDTIEAAPPARRSTLVGMFNGSLYTVRLLAQPPAAPPSRRGGLDALEHRYAVALAGHGVRVTGRRPLLGAIAGTPASPGRTLFAPVTISVALRDGHILAVDGRPSPLVRGYLRHRSFLGAVSGLIIIAILLLAVRQTTRPLARLSAGVRRFSTDLDTPDLAVGGSRELRELALAFNEMKTRINELIGERSRALAGIAHDMRTYLTRLRLRAEFIDDPEQRARAGADLDEMALLLDDTLLFARRDAGASAPPRPIALPAEIAAMVAVRAEMGEAVRCGAVPDLTIRADPVAFRRMLANLVDNGVRHGGDVAIEVRIRANRVDIAVLDDGPGVPARALARLGEPFGRIDPSRDRESGGAGLGLAIVRALAEREGGTVRFANRPEGGFAATLSFAIHESGI